jgi:hypothetical protein
MQKSAIIKGSFGITNRFLTLLVIIVLTTSCKNEKELSIKGSFAYDKSFLKEHYIDLIILAKDEAEVLISPELQGRVMTSTANAKNGKGFGWLNYDLISSGKLMEHFNPIGGEERLWLGPEGGQFSIYFEQGTTFKFNNWYVPKELDTEAFELKKSSNLEASFVKKMKLTNYSGTVLNIKIDRTIKLISKTEASKNLGIKFPEGVSMVGFQTDNILTNTGQNTWDKSTGMLSIWILSMLSSSEGTTIVVPFKKGNEADLGKIVTDDYFGKVPGDRLLIGDSVLLFKADGKQRGKIGISQKRTMPIIGSYDAKNKVLTVAKFSLPKEKTDYVNSLWQIQEHPFAGDAVNAYNDGPLEDGSQLGSFYEIESSSPAANLNPGGSIQHIHQTYHFEGDEKTLGGILEQLFGVSVSEIKKMN